MKRIAEWVAVTLALAGSFLTGTMLGMAFDPNAEYCRDRSITPLAPVDCHYEQSSDGQGLEVCD